MQSKATKLFCRCPYSTAKQSRERKIISTGIISIFPVVQLQAHSDIKQVRDSSRVQGQIQPHVKNATLLITLVLDLGADKDTIFWLRYNCGQDELSTSSQQLNPSSLRI